MLSKIWLFMVGTAILVGAANGRLEAVGTAALEGASAAIQLCLGILGPVCLWTGVTELLSESGASSALARAMRPVLSLLFPGQRQNKPLMEKISANLTANLLGLGNAATPLGMAAASELGKLCTDGRASRELCTLVILNTASLQLIPATVAAVRSSLGSPRPFDILPAVWIASAGALLVGLLVGALGEKLSLLRRNNS
jgi:spore maturation protein A